MKKNKLTQKDWLEYLDNLNIREISKRNSSGFTTWALFGLIGFISFRVLDILPTVCMDIERVFLIKLFMTNFFNLCIVISVFMVFLAMTPRLYKRKIYTIFMWNTYVFVRAVLFFIYIIGFFSNIYIAFVLKNYKLNILPYRFFTIYVTVFIIGILINIFFTKKENNMPRIDSGYLYNNPKHINLVKNIYLFFCLVLSLSLAFSIYQIMQNYNILNYLIILKLVFYLITFIGAIILLVFNIIILIRNIGLEDFERKIMLQNLSENEIVKEFIDKFVGKDITQWLKEIEDETKEITTRFIKLYDKFNKEIDSLDKNEKDLNKRIMKAETILKNITERGKNVSKKDIEKFKNNTEKIDYFLKQGPLSDEEELIISEFNRNRKKDGEVLFDADYKIKTGIKKLGKYVNDIKKLADLKDK